MVSLIALAIGLGCRMGVPLVVYEAPLSEITIAGPVAIASLVGSPHLTQPIETQLLATAPRDRMPVLGPEDLVREDRVRQASATSGPSDLMMLTAARELNAEYLLAGEVLTVPEVVAGKNGTTALLPEGRLAVAWKLVNVKTGETVQALPMSMDSAEALKKYPDLGLQPQDELALLSAAAARESWKLLQPYVTRSRVQLALPWMTGGAERIRQGNAYAYAGRWPEAEEHWRTALEQHPKSHAAVHNLALAAAARQDFADARKRAQEAAAMHPCDHYESTYAWIEKQRWAYHRAFNLPDPEDGWPLRSAPLP